MASVRVWQSDTIELPFAIGKLGDGLVIVMQSVSGEVRAGLKGYGAQIVVASVMACITLGVGNGGRQLVNLGGCFCVRAGQVGGLCGSMAGRTPGEMVISPSCLRRLGGKVTGETFLTEGLHKGFFSMAGSKAARPVMPLVLQGTWTAKIPIQAF